MRFRLKNKGNKLLNLQKIVIAMVIWGVSWPALSAKAELADLTDFVNNLQTFSASFEQIQPDETLFQKNLSTGDFVMQRPGLLRWVYKTPERQKIVSDGRNVWVYDEDLDQVTVQSLDRVEADFPLSWLLYQQPLSERFDIIVGEKKTGVSWYNLKPKQGTFFQSLEVAISHGRLVQIWMYQNADNVTKVTFNDIRQNQPVDLQQFEFTPPKGVDVIGQPLP
ncbi:MAG: outer membrane lipoprotein carrier protein LolA [Piscirickettsiaceae bacterium CG_4_9_14_3_um_filter_43_564]|nr:outer membrane lipoprotein chaperone LolA [Thiomicrospira sp.]PIQ04935.1 MAG: outer membrane lipoprotein carrier protein LolA [Piscirickettsiaceae bacterium CG18_big_fil_WC_8_21_14_2_50_44_103]PIU38246.1 MAG: outer membrane lipoprotein carrier protein LolA [Piscirickettsiaceae bacterium CG07_land_8_20_14_0_80_44_28]PIW57338.1 MAG: outer membrane lipoprotein carrier protein LolA [Piscirickettsiaceae bacterium CG12_big_fil_rev_8_21_14_0_65_44_934]PIW76942.1 MAG: outer membrane lipoprotein carr